ncbi:MAG: hypothetical protein GXP55_26210, partial [Deltaproteobacteria bacterium]|nr:hypothetical protein [Deltaproteobacteria bacterium]
CRYEGATSCTCGTLVCGDAGGPTPSCTSNRDCAATDYCAFASGCGGRGVCETRPEVCIAVYAPVCGCDGTTYGNSCNAAGAGANISHDGECDCRDTGCASGSNCQLCRGASGGINVCIPDGSIC